ncbi:MAG: 2,3-bisphosphoglycerate-independent phosphoglycerate mutase [archaeon]|nr:2,3-bisphosphoglycerate-independent phosphoglycerate mutase [archaeon]
MVSMKSPIVYVILDGWGIAPNGKGNAVARANTPNFDWLRKNYSYTEIGAGGESVGLWKGHQGSSEIGHFIIGAGRNVMLPNGIVARSIANKSIFKNKIYLNAMNYVKKHNSTLHISALMSDRGVHSYDVLVHALIEMAAKNKVKDVVVHFISDGRDSGTHDAKKYLSRLEKVMKKNKIGRIGSVIGRYWIMDRNHRWERVEKSYNAMIYGEAEYYTKSAKEAIENAYKREKSAEKKEENFVESDEFISPTVIVDKKGIPVGKIKDNDAFIWANFRTDRAIEISQAFTEPKFNKFNRKEKKNIHYVATFEYYKGIRCPHAFEREYPKNTLGGIISEAGLKQYRVTETEKWIYVTTVFSGMREKPFKGETRKLIPSDKIPTYDLKPKMHALDIAKDAVKAIDSGKYALILINLNNPDIIGHTGFIKSAIIGVEECDKALGLIIDATRHKDGLAIVSADHGNAEVMLQKNGEPNTNHTANNVPFIIVDDDPKFKKIKLKKGGAIKDVTPTILKILNIKKPKEMTGKALF